MLAPGVREPVARQQFDYSITGSIILTRVLSRTAGGDETLERDFRLLLKRAGSKPGGMLTAERSKDAFHRFAHGYNVENGGK
ncbi:hypothetical protein AB0J71_32870 [Nonomuraea sp. NPDC049637]|uniref:hypothetical protein n=1 Tax=Nonomuraea sp. NPDC049637 TaxID=3154356 RepID=UPI003441EC44